MREIVTSQFISMIGSHLEGIKRVAVVGGDQNDPEIIELQKLISFELVSHGVDDHSNVFLDLNSLQEISLQYDLVVCSQVLEHIFDVKTGIENLAKLVRLQGLIWLACPASNRSHGSPHYYSAGYQPELVVAISKQFNLSPLGYGKVGSKRNYFFTHALRVWPNPDELNHPITKYDLNRYQGSKFIKLIRFIRDLPGRIYSCFISNKINESVEFATESYVLLQRNK
jgi:hypothetical protein